MSEKNNPNSETGEININTIERTKCRATGKVRFGTEVEAKFFVHWLHWRFKSWMRSKNRTRKRLGNKPTARYTYRCTYCNGYHITTQGPWKYHKRSNK